MLHLQLDENIERILDDAEPPRRQRNEMFRARRESALGLGDLAFKRRFGFTKTGFEELLQYCGEMQPTDNRGNPIPAHIKILDALTVLRGNTFMEEAGHNIGVSGNGSFISLHQFCETITNQKATWVCMPTRHEINKLADQYNEDYGLENLPIGIDGKLFRLKDKPRFKNPPGRMDPQEQDYWSYKNTYAINGQMVCDGTYFRDVVVHSPGRMNDASIYASSQFNVEWTTNYRPFCVAGDSAYPSSVALVTPFTEREMSNDANIAAKQRDFNKRHSQIRTVQTENMFGRLVKQFPVLNQLRYFMEFNQKVILCCIILFNIKAFIRERDDVDNDSDDENAADEEDDQDHEDVEVYLLPASIQERRLEGQLVRTSLMNRMLPR